jgi:hypothetical protein
MKRANLKLKRVVLAAGCVLAIILAGCKSNPSPATGSASAPATRAASRNTTDASRLSAGGSKLIDAMSKPTTSFHFSYKGQENISEKYMRDRTQAPEVGPVDLEADISPDEVDLTQTRGKTTKESKAKKGDEMNWGMASLTLMGVVTSPNFSIAIGSIVASSPSSDLVGTTPVDKYTFDTATAAGSQKMAIDAARSVLTNIKETKGTAWIAKDSGVMVKFNIDTEYLDKNGHAWQEHYEGEVTPK